MGIVNGLDVDEWDPATQPALAAPFSAADPSGKAACRAALLQETGLEDDPDGPVLGVVSRFTGQKGLDLVCDAAPALLRRGARLVVLGTGEPNLQHRFSSLAARFPSRVGLKVGFDAGLAHRVVAGSDLFLVPSRFEPCGLTQMQAMRYGAVPVVHAVGGLRDTVADPGDERLMLGEGQGFRFEHPTAEGLLWAADRAINRWRHDKQGWDRLVRAIMAQDLSWTGPAAAYRRLYELVLAR
jgi:starch synthase